ncbi:MAG: DNA translocase FtsK [Rikenellaceae bacterium]|nr:DNA translocase FtsK [Rikenellaceae bacterium]
MALKSKKYTATTKTSRPKDGAEKEKNTKYRQWMLGFALLFFAFYIAISVFSYMLYWKNDQAVGRLPLSETDGDGIYNWGGRLGVKIGELLVTDSFGLFGFLIPVTLIILALRVLSYRPMFLNKSVRICLIGLILGSITLGYIGNFFPGEGAFGSGLGGAHGVYIAQWIESYLSYGTGLLLLLLIAFFAVYINRNTISLINRFGKGLANKSKDITVTVASRASDLMQAKENKITSEEAEESDCIEDIPVKEEVTALKEDLDYSFEDDKVEPIKPIVAKEGKKSFDSTDFEFTVRSEDGEEYLYEKKNPFVDKVEETTRFEEGFVIRDEHGNVTETIDPFGEVNDICTDNPSPRGDIELLANNDESSTIVVDDMFTVDKHVEETIPDELIDTNYDHTLDLSYYQKPPVELLEDHTIEVNVTENELIGNKNRILETLENFGIKIDKIKATIGPTVTLYEIVPAPGVRISKIKNLEDDIALSLSALGIRIIAPMPGKGTIGIEVPNKDKEIVSMYSVIKSVKFQESDYELPLVLGKTIQNETFVIDLAKMPHVLVAGATGQGKSVGLNAIITSLLYKKHPSELKFVLVDPKKVELTLYSKLEKHFLAKLPGEDDAIITDTQKVIYTLNSLCIEMDARYDLLRKAEVRNIKEYNAKFTKRRLNPEKGHRYLPYIVVIIDEFADMIMTAGREVESPIARIAQLARAVGIHLVIATQRPTTNIITGLIKANFPARIAFRVTSMIDSRTIIDQPGANQLIGRGDMLISNGSDITRVQCAFLDTPEVERIMEFISNQQGYPCAYELPEYVPEGESGMPDADLTRRDSMFEEAARLIVAHQQGSTSLIQRKFSIGYNRAGRIMDQREVAGIVGKSEGSKPREVKISDMGSLELLLNNIDNFH